MPVQSPRAAALVVLALTACATPDHPGAAPTPKASATAPPATRCTPPDRRAALDAFLSGHREAYAASIKKARAFLDGLEVDPAKLRAANIKGKKKLAEAIDAYYRLWLVAAPDARAALLARVTELARPTTEERYHDLATLADRELREDATSYLRVAVLLERMGVDTKRYREEIARAQPRLDAQMKDRGPHQRRAFHAYYQHFGLREPFPLEGALEKGFIAGRADPDKLARLDVYAVTHEIYAGYDFGDRLDADPFSDADRDYLRGALPRFVDRFLHDVDLAAELVTCLRYVRFTGEPAYTAGLDRLLATQNDDGSWGSYAAARARLGDYVKQGLYLHTTMVAIEALTTAFEDLYRKGEGPVCSG